MAILKKKDEKKAAPAAKETKGKDCGSKTCPVKKEAVKKEAEAAPAEAATERNDKVRRYHIVQHPSGGWTVKFAEGEKNIKIFKTQKEAHDYASQMAENQKGRGVKASVVVHSKKGKLRKMH